jgi:hypothetical protein
VPFAEVGGNPVMNGKGVASEVVNKFGVPEQVAKTRPI